MLNRNWIYLAFAFLLQAIIAFIDVQLLTIDEPFDYWPYVRESALALSVIVLYLILEKIYRQKERSLRDSLLKIIQNVILIFTIGFVLGKLITPIYSPDGNPPVPLTERTVVYLAIISMVVFYAFVDSFIQLKSFIYFYRDRFTHIQYYLLILLFFTTSVTYIFADLNSLFDFKFSAQTILTEVLTIVSFLVVLWLTTRYKWIPPLNRKEKYFYFFGSLFFLVTLTFLVQWIDVIVIHSRFAYAMGNLLYAFIFLYTLFAVIYLVLHLPTARILDQKLKEINSLQSLTSAITTELDADRLIVMITKTVSEVMGSHSCWLMLHNKEDNKTYMGSYQNLTHQQITAIGEGKDNALSDTILNNGDSLFIETISQVPRYHYLKQIFPGIESLMAVPLISAKSKKIGVIYVLKNVSYGFSKEQLSVFEIFAQHTIVAIENTQRIKESLDRQRLHQEMKIAKEVQHRLLPQTTPASQCLDIATMSQPAREVGGDYFDFITGVNKNLMLVGDVSGKGTSAAFYMAELKGAIQANRHLIDSPIDLLVKTNNSLFDSLDRSTFITLAALLIDEDKNLVRFSRAGHNGLIILKKNGEAIVQEPKGIGIGLAKGLIFDSNIGEFEQSLYDNDIYILYTDGISEAMNASNDEFGTDRLIETVRRNSDRSAKEIVTSVTQALRNFAGTVPPHDDMTLIIVKVCKKEELVTEKSDQGASHEERI
jgi:sigma-B regulation protein RsbU (phosphoserine phosphatase)